MQVLISFGCYQAHQRSSHVVMHAQQLHSVLCVLRLHTLTWLLCLSLLCRCTHPAGAAQQQRDQPRIYLTTSIAGKSGSAGRSTCTPKPGLTFSLYAGAQCAHQLVIPTTAAAAAEQCCWNQQPPPLILKTGQSLAPS